MPRYQVVVDDKEFDVELEYRSEKYEIVINGRTLSVESHRLGESRSLLLVDNQSVEVDVRANGVGREKTVFMKGLEIPVTVEDFHLAKLRRTAGMATGPAAESSLKAPMPGLMVDIKVEVGTQVKPGDPLVVIEAMKMENIIKARGKAIVKKVCVTDGQSVEKGDMILEFE
jgi:biotin carboxyl carrier protein